ncbi:phage tail protein I [Bacillus sp. FJAT-27264]|uniref:phage tail protein I n=1 Tax=Paenibacillus sp. (strain DSM 101736 / FJAT-27264) TaxID=1850362 RepID=UPI000807B563|nr:phage tail protein I [Bacillus sp. FJAT-27264]OBZ08934.1 phage tail protein I [Bacillus sp. FJAT-27264]
MINIQTVSLRDILPPSIANDPTVAAAASALDAELQATTALISQLDIYGRSEEWTSEETDELAWEYHIDYYDPDLPLEQRRQLVVNAIPFHRRKATPSAVEDLITILFGSGKVEEWFEYGGAPYHFQVATDNPDVTTARAQEFIQAVESVKRLSAVLDRVVISQTEDLNLYFGGALHIGERLTV